MKVTVLKAVAGDNFLYRNGTYSVPEQMPFEHAKSLIKAGHAIEERTQPETATQKEVTLKRKK